VGRNVLYLTAVAFKESALSMQDFPGVAAQPVTGAEGAGLPLLSTSLIRLKPSLAEYASPSIKLQKNK
jgi:hypothetical protein